MQFDTVIQRLDRPAWRVWSGWAWAHGPRVWGIGFVWGLRRNSHPGERAYRHSICLYVPLPRVIWSLPRIERY